jgi:hypothetical protein
MVPMLHGCVFDYYLRIAVSVSCITCHTWLVTVSSSQQWALLHVSVHVGSMSLELLTTVQVNQSCSSWQQQMHVLHEHVS